MNLAYAMDSRKKGISECISATGFPPKSSNDPEVDVLRIVFSNAPIEERDEEKPGIILDFNKGGNAVALEILDPSKGMENPPAIEYAAAG